MPTGPALPLASVPFAVTLMELPPRPFSRKRVPAMPLFDASPHTHATGGLVTFEPGARTAWHTHPAGQTLIVTSGTGWVQEWGGERQQIRPGDVISIPPNVNVLPLVVDPEAMRLSMTQCLGPLSLAD